MMYESPKAQNGPIKITQLALQKEYSSFERTQTVQVPQNVIQEIFRDTFDREEEEDGNSLMGLTRPILASQIPYKPNQTQLEDRQFKNLAKQSKPMEMRTGGLNNKVNFADNSHQMPRESDRQHVVSGHKSLGAEERITYYSNNFGYSNLNPSSYNGALPHPTIPPVLNNNPMLQPSNPKFTAVDLNNQQPTPPSELLRANQNDSSVIYKPAMAKNIRINGVVITNKPLSQAPFPNLPLIGMRGLPIQTDQRQLESKPFVHLRSQEQRPTPVTESHLFPDHMSYPSSYPNQQLHQKPLAAFSAPPNRKPLVLPAIQNVFQRGSPQTPLMPTQQLMPSQFMPQQQIPQRSQAQYQQYPSQMPEMAHNNTYQAQIQAQLAQIAAMQQQLMEQQNIILSNNNAQNKQQHTLQPYQYQQQSYAAPSSNYQRPSDARYRDDAVYKVSTQGSSTLSRDFDQQQSRGESSGVPNQMQQQKQQQYEGPKIREERNYGYKPTSITNNQSYKPASGKSYKGPTSDKSSSGNYNNYHYKNYSELKETAKQELSRGPGANIGSDEWQAAKEKHVASKQISEQIRQKNKVMLKRKDNYEIKQIKNTATAQQPSYQEKVKQYAKGIPKPKLKPKEVEEPDISHITKLPGAHAQVIKRQKQPTPEKQMSDEYHMLEERNEFYKGQVDKIKHLFHI